MAIKNSKWVQKNDLGRGTSYREDCSVRDGAGSLVVASNRGFPTTKDSQVGGGRSSQAIFDNNEVCMIPDCLSIPFPLSFSFVEESFSGELDKGCLGVDVVI